MKEIIKTTIIVILVMVIVIVITVIQDSLRKSKIKKWPSVEGTIIRSFVMTKCETLQERYHPVVRYAYTVDGKEYQKLQYNSLSSGYIEKKSAQKIVDKYPEGSTVTVHYDPENHSKSIPAGLSLAPWSKN